MTPYLKGVRTRVSKISINKLVTTGICIITLLSMGLVGLNSFSQNNATAQAASVSSLEKKGLTIPDYTKDILKKLSFGNLFSNPAETINNINAISKQVDELNKLYSVQIAADKTKLSDQITAVEKDVSTYQYSPEKSAIYSSSILQLKKELLNNTLLGEFENSLNKVDVLNKDLKTEKDYNTKKQNIASALARSSEGENAITFLASYPSLTPAIAFAEYRSFINYFNNATAWSADTVEQVQTNINDYNAKIQYLNNEQARISLLREDQRREAERVAQEKLKAEEYARIAAATGKRILVSLTDQTLYAYENNNIVYTTKITSGKDSTPTVTGNYNIYEKRSNIYLTGPGYSLHVDYWMPFFQGYGIHDAYWRSVYGGEDYHWAGSHGCLNTPHDAVEWIWNWAPVGTPVTVVD
jgi:lipoprotein-anchoring transpeptidase ErfK/SrfK